jgi:hypothetical protein
VSRADLMAAAELLERLLPQVTPGPWRDTSVDGNRYGAVVTDTCIRRCDDYAAGLDHLGLVAWERELLDHHPHEGYGGCLVGESHTPCDRRLIAVLRNVADHLPALLESVAAEDPVAAGAAARAIAGAVVATHRPRSDS